MPFTLPRTLEGLYIVLFLVAVHAAPFEEPVNPFIHTIPAGDSIRAYHPPSEYETYGAAGFTHALSKRADASFSAVAQGFAADRSGLNASDFLERASIADGPSKVVYLNQQLNGIQVANSVAHVAVNSENNVASFTRSFFQAPKSVSPPDPTITLADATSIAEKAFGSKANGIHSLEYFIKETGDAVLTHVIRVESEEEIASYEVFVDAHDGSIVSYNDFITHATYRVIPIERQDPTTGFSLVQNPELTSVSPRGWVSNHATEGNNAIAFRGTPSATAAETSDGVFDYPWSNSTQPDTDANVAAAKVNAFYIVNSLHDITYLYGFNEGAFNYQVDNLSKGGKGGDPVLISVQNSTSFNNAVMSVTPEGESSRLSLFIFNQTTPHKDPSFSNDIVSHEFTHGLTNRLVGGGSARCLQSAESRALGEGWSDVMADWVEQSSSPIKDWVTGKWILSKAGGVRRYPYSRNLNTNPLTYGKYDASLRTHDNGEIMANLLHNLHAALVESKGFSARAKVDSSGTAGNVIFMHLFINHFKALPCNPGYIAARDGLLQAEQDLYKGEYKCLLWRVFSGRGFGANAKAMTGAAGEKIQEDFSEPSGC